MPIASVMSLQWPISTIRKARKALASTGTTAETAMNNRRRRGLR